MIVCGRWKKPVNFFQRFECFIGTAQIFEEKLTQNPELLFPCGGGGYTFYLLGNSICEWKLCVGLMRLPQRDCRARNFISARVNFSPKSDDFTIRFDFFLFLTRFTFGCFSYRKYLFNVQEVCFDHKNWNFFICGEARPHLLVQMFGVFPSQQVLDKIRKKH